MKTNELLAGISTLSLLLALGCKADKQSALPNIVFILADDLGYGDLSCLNRDSQIKTPAVDQLAHEGIIFTNAHSPSAVCSPTRYGILTGEYCFRTTLKSGVLTGYSPSLIDPRKTTVAELLKTAGYYTICIGKWHLGLDWARKDTTLPLFTGDPWSPETSNVDYNAHVPGGPADQGFDYSFIIPSSLDIVPYCYIRNGSLTAPVHDTITGRNKPRGIFYRSGDIQEGFRLETVLETFTHEAIQQIDDQSGRKSPFFLYLPLNAPHEPWLPSAEFHGKSGAGTYGDYVLQIDHCIAQVMDAIKMHNLEKNTIVIITSDNGSNWIPEDIARWNHKGNWIFRGQKSDAWDGGHHIPLLVRWPEKIKAGQTSGQLICLTDLFATCAELTGYQAKPTEGRDSYSFLPVLTGKKPLSPLRVSAVHHSISGMFAITSGQWKLIDGKGSGGWSPGGETDPAAGQLYDLKNDPGETVNLFDRNPDITRDLLKQLNDIRSEQSPF
jgi:arylsulfatase A